MRPHSFYLQTDGHHNEQVMRCAGWRQVASYAVGGRVGWKMATYHAGAPGSGETPHPSSRWRPEVGAVPWQPSCCSCTDLRRNSGASERDGRRADRPTRPERQTDTQRCGRAEREAGRQADRHTRRRAETQTGRRAAWGASVPQSLTIQRVCGDDNTGGPRKTQLTCGGWRQAHAPTDNDTPGCKPRCQPGPADEDLLQ